MPTRTNLKLDVDLERGVVPISKAASSLAALIKRANTTGQPVIVTQKGYPTGVLLPIELFTALKSLADGQGKAEQRSIDENGAPEAAEAPATSPEAAPPRPAPRRRKPKVTPTDEVAA